MPRLQIPIGHRFRRDNFVADLLVALADVSAIRRALDLKSEGHLRVAVLQLWFENLPGLPPLQPRRETLAVKEVVSLVRSESLEGDQTAASPSAESLATTLTVLAGIPTWDTESVSRAVLVSLVERCPDQQEARYVGRASRDSLGRASVSCTPAGLTPTSVQPGSTRPARLTQTGR